MMHSWQSLPKRRKYPSLPTFVGSALSLSVLKTDVLTSQRPYSLKYDWFLSGCWCSVSLPRWALVVITRRFSFSGEMPLPNSNPCPPGPEDTPTRFLGPTSASDWLPCGVQKAAPHLPQVGANSAMQSVLLSLLARAEWSQPPAETTFLLTFPHATRPHLASLAPLLLGVILRETTSTRIPISGSTCMEPDLR